MTCPVACTIVELSQIYQDGERLAGGDLLIDYIKESEDIDSQVHGRFSVCAVGFPDQEDDSTSQSTQCNMLCDTACEKRNYKGNISVFNMTDVPDGIQIEEYSLDGIYYCPTGHELVDATKTVCKTTLGKKKTIQFKCPLSLDCTLLPYVTDYDESSNPMLRFAREQSEENSVANVKICAAASALEECN